MLTMLVLTVIGAKKQVQRNSQQRCRDAGDCAGAGGDCAAGDCAGAGVQGAGADMQRCRGVGHVGVGVGVGVRGGGGEVQRCREEAEKVLRRC